MRRRALPLLALLATIASPACAQCNTCGNPGNGQVFFNQQLTVQQQPNRPGYVQIQIQPSQPSAVRNQQVLVWYGNPNQPGVVSNQQPQGQGSVQYINVNPQPNQNQQPGYLQPNRNIPQQQQPQTNPYNTINRDQGYGQQGFGQGQQNVGAYPSVFPANPTVTSTPFPYSTTTPTYNIASSQTPILQNFGGQVAQRDPIVSSTPSAPFYSPTPSPSTASPLPFIVTTSPTPLQPYPPQSDSYPNGFSTTASPVSASSVYPVLSPPVQFDQGVQGQPSNTRTVVFTQTYTGPASNLPNFAGNQAGQLFNQGPSASSNNNDAVLSAGLAAGLAAAGYDPSSSSTMAPGQADLSQSGSNSDPLAAGVALGIAAGAAVSQNTTGQMQSPDYRGEAQSTDYRDDFTATPNADPTAAGTASQSTDYRDDFSGSPNVNDPSMAGTAAGLAAVQNTNHPQDNSDSIVAGMAAGLAAGAALAQENSVTPSSTPFPVQLDQSVSPSDPLIAAGAAAALGAVLGSGSTTPAPSSAFYPTGQRTVGSTTPFPYSTQTVQAFPEFSTIAPQDFQHFSNGDGQPSQDPNMAVLGRDQELNQGSQEFNRGNQELNQGNQELNGSSIYPSIAAGLAAGAAAAGYNSESTVPPFSPVSSSTANPSTPRVVSPTSTSQSLQPTSTTGFPSTTTMSPTTTSSYGSQYPITGTPVNQGPLGVSSFQGQQGFTQQQPTSTMMPVQEGQQQQFSSTIGSPTTTFNNPTTQSFQPTSQQPLSFQPSTTTGFPSTQQQQFTSIQPSTQFDQTSSAVPFQAGQQFPSSTQQFQQPTTQFQPNPTTTTQFPSTQRPTTTTGVPFTSTQGTGNVAYMAGQTTPGGFSSTGFPANQPTTAFPQQSGAQVSSGTRQYDPTGINTPYGQYTAPDGTGTTSGIQRDQIVNSGSRGLSIVLGLFLALLLH